MAHVIVVGSFVQDLTFYTDEFPQPGETRIGRFVTGPGGKGSNQAVACHRQGVATLFLGAVGDDLFATGYREFCQHESLRVELQTVPGASTGTASIVVNRRGQNLITVALGACDELSADFIVQFSSEVQASRVLVTQLECNLAATRQALRLAREAGVIGILNPAPINAAVTAELIQRAEVLVPNESEFAYLLQTVAGDQSPIDPHTAADVDLHLACKQLGVATVVLTLGDQGCFVSHHREISPCRCAATDTLDYYRVPAIKVNCTDTTGAGDAFTGGLAAGMTLFPHSFQIAVRYATVVAGLSTTRAGTAPSMPTKEETMARFSDEYSY